MTKAELRKQMRARVAGISPEERAARSRAVCDALLLLPEYQHAKTVMIFVSMDGEVDTRPIADELFGCGITVLVPCVDWQTSQMHAARIQSIDSDIVRDARGVPGPVNTAEFPVGQIDFVCVPGLAFDAVGNRLGRGGGFYDRFLANPELRAVRCGLAFDEQIVESVPVADHDQAVDFLVTPTGVQRVSR